MKRQEKNNKNKSGQRDGANSWKKIDKESGLNAEDSALFERISNYMKARFDLEEVRNHSIIDTDIKKMISDYQDNDTKSEENAKFIKDSFSELRHENEIVSEIEDIKQEIGANDIDKISAEWVKEWNDRHNKDVPLSSKEIEIRNFISEFLNPDKSDTEISTKTFKRDRNSRSYIIRIIPLTAAAILGLFIVFKIILPSSDPEKLFKTYYTTFNYVSSATREAGVSLQEDFSVAVEQYKAGDYNSASTGFSNIIMKDSSFVTPRFLLGLTNLELGEYDKAINLFNSIKDPSNKYYKETLWYLGLAYLRIGEKTHASDCFKILASSSGYYYDRAKKILRRLK
jgi:TolA-binding protein